jgi:hypothetical protein
VTRPIAEVAEQLRPLADWLGTLDAGQGHRTA